jgi:hypothetical protein
MADGFVPPQGVRNNAKRGLELRKKHGRGGTAVGVARARSLSNGQALPLDTIRRMVSYFARHEVDKKGEGWGVDSAGYIAWLLWGGDAGKRWADGISEREKKKDKSMTNDMTSAYAEIVKQEKQDDGTLLVYGKATDDSVDIDLQICDAAWLNKAMPEWFKTGGNIREQHSNIAAGVAKELDSTGDGHYISALVVDPISVKKVETGVLKGFSIGIRAPRVVRDEKAANGRIIDGQIVEISLVDRPANPNAKLMLAKSVEGETSLVQVEELTELIDETQIAKGEKMEHEDDKAVSEKPSKEDMLKELEDCKNAYMAAKEACKEAGFLDDEEKEEEDEELAEEKRTYGESAEEESEEGSSGSGAEHELGEAEGKKKSIDTIVPEPDVVEIGDTEKEEEEDDEIGFEQKTINAIIQKAVKSATESVRNEIDILKSANEADKDIISKLQTELASANQKAVSGGPKRSTIKPDNAVNEFAIMALTYRQKAAATSDKTLALGYKELAKDFEAKANAVAE